MHQDFILECADCHKCYIIVDHYCKAIETGLFHKKITHCNLAKDIGLMISCINPFFFCTFVAVPMASYRLLCLRWSEGVTVDAFCDAIDDNKTFTEEVRVNDTLLIPGISFLFFKYSMCTYKFLIHSAGHILLRIDRKDVRSSTKQQIREYLAGKTGKKADEETFIGTVADPLPSLLIMNQVNGSL